MKMDNPRSAARYPQGGGTGHPAKPARRCPELYNLMRRAYGMKMGALK